MNVKKKTFQKTKADWPPNWENGSQIGSPPKLLKNASPVKYPFWLGDKVVCLLEIGCLRKMQEDYGWWNSKMAMSIGKTGSVCGITGQGGVRVRFSRNISWTFHPGALTKLNAFSVGDVVRVVDDLERVKKLQLDHGNWREEMTRTVGQVGKVMKVHKDGDLRVQFRDKSWIFNPACLGKHDENFVTPINIRETKYSGRTHPALSASALMTKKANPRETSPVAKGTAEALAKPAESPTKESVRRCIFQAEDDITDFLDIKIVQKTYGSTVPDRFKDLNNLFCNTEAPINVPDGHDELSVEMASEEASNSTASTEMWLTDSPEPLKEVSLEKTTPVVPEAESRFTVCKRFLGDFEDITKIDSGGFGTVFKARHRLDKKVYAIKRVKLTDDGGEGEREVQALVKLEYKYIVRYHTCWIGSDTYESEDSSCDSSSEKGYFCDYCFIQMEFCAKKTLECWIDQKNDQSNDQTCEDDVFLKFQQLVKGVAYIHSQGIIHRDLKPSNIFISSQDKIKIGDFGLATSGVDDLSVKRTKSKGTRSYMAPEQMGTTYGKEVDVFPLGLIWFEMLYRFGTKFERSKKWEDIRECKFPPEFDEQFPAEAPIIKQLLSKEPSKRLCIHVLLDLLNRDKFGRQESIAKSVKNQSEAWIG